MMIEIHRLMYRIFNLFNSMLKKSISRAQIDTAFKKLKRFVYYDKTDLALRLKVAQFERSNTFEEDLDELHSVVNSSDIRLEDAFVEWVDAIQYRIVPKKIAPARILLNGDSGTFITNRTSATSYTIESVNYFFDGAVQLHLIAVLWTMLEGRYLDATLGAECYGARLESLQSSAFDTSARLYQRYHSLYKRWRDKGIAKAKQILSEERTSVCILGLDVKEYYYHVAINYKEVAEVISEEMRHGVGKDDCTSSTTGLLGAVEYIGMQYKKKISASLTLTHPDLPYNIQGLPIGLLSSQLLANWYLKTFDAAVKEEIRPAYYGRYVDDILLVVPAPANLSSASPIDQMMDKLFVSTGLLNKRAGGLYETSMRDGLFLQREKCILQYFDAEHSIAGLDKFQKNLEANGSDFLLMPVDEADTSLEDVAYEILYDGSVNKFRSVKGVAENRYGLAKYLGRQTMLNLLTDEPSGRKKNSSVLNFFRGRSAIEFHDLWERVLTLLFVSDDMIGFRQFERNIRIEIEKVAFSSDKILRKIKNNLLQHLTRSVSMSLALGDVAMLDSRALKFRRANLIRHHFIRMPLVNYTDYRGSLITRDIPLTLKLSPEKLKHSPRYLNFDECMLLVMSGRLHDNIKEGTHAQHFMRAMEIFESANQRQVQGLTWDVAFRRNA
jgi:hypothetical protein